MNQLQSEWAAATEEQLNRYFFNNSKLLEEFGYPRIHCRTNHCGVAFARSGVENELNDAACLFRELVSDFADQPWQDEFPEPLGLEINTDNGVTTVYFGLGLRNRLNSRE